MNSLKNIIITVLLTMLMIPHGWSQTTINQPSANSAYGESWKPINNFAAPKNENQTSNNIAVAPPLINVLNGVSFYSRESECNSEKVILLKLINTNNYAVKVSWQMSPNSPKEYILVPALKDFEGSCTINDKNKAKLIIKNLNGPDKAEIIKYALSQINVIKAEK